MARDSAHDTQRKTVSSRDGRRGIRTVEWVVVPDGEQHVPFGGAGDRVHEPRADGVDGVGRVDAVLQVACVRGLGAKEVSGWARWWRSAWLSHGRLSAWLSAGCSLPAWVQQTKGAPTLSVLNAGADRKASWSQGATGAAAPASVQWAGGRGGSHGRAWLSPYTGWPDGDVLILNRLWVNVASAARFHLPGSLARAGKSVSKSLRDLQARGQHGRRGPRPGAAAGARRALRWLGLGARTLRRRLLLHRRPGGGALAAAPGLDAALLGVLREVDVAHLAGVTGLRHGLPRVLEVRSVRACAERQAVDDDCFWPQLAFLEAVDAQVIITRKS